MEQALQREAGRPQIGGGLVQLEDRVELLFLEHHAVPAGAALEHRQATADDLDELLPARSAT